MNTTVLALQEEQVLVAVGKSGAQPSVQALYSAPAHGGGMENWEKAIGALWQQHRLPTRGITLVLPDEAVATKTITAPSMPVNKLEELVRHEMRPREDQLAAADYVPLGTDAEGRQQLFCAACRKETMEEYLAMTDRLGLRLQSVTVTMAGRLKLLHAMQSMQGKTCIWLCFEGSSVLSLLVENGEYRYSSRSRIFSEPGTVDFGTEMTRDVSGTMQFHTASRSGGTLTDVGDLAAMRDILTTNGWTPLTAVCTILFSLMHWPCSTTVMTIRGETGSLRHTLAAVLLPTLAGAAICFLVATAARLVG